jgi:hypothetical protein
VSSRSSTLSSKTEESRERWDDVQTLSKEAVSVDTFSRVGKRSVQIGEGMSRSPLRQKEIRFLPNLLSWLRSIEPCLFRDPCTPPASSQPLSRTDFPRSQWQSRIEPSTTPLWRWQTRIDARGEDMLSGISELRVQGGWKLAAATANAGPYGP